MLICAYLIYNPIAGQGDTEQELEAILGYLDPLKVHVRRTTPEVDADQLAREAVSANASVVIASGGDGTVSLTASALIGTDIPLGIIPRGTANALAVALGIPHEIEAACQTIMADHRRKIDTATCNEQPMILLAGIGFEAETVEQADRPTKDRLGTFAYVLSGIQQLGEMSQFQTILETPEQRIEVSAAAVTVANIAPPTSVLAQGPAQIICDDGLLDITIVSPENVAGAIAASYQLFHTALRNEAVERPDVGYFRAESVMITTDPPQKVVVDGELVGTTPIFVQSIPQGLTLLVPPVPGEQPLERLPGLPNLKIEPKTPMSDYGGQDEEDPHHR